MMAPAYVSRVLRHCAACFAFERLFALVSKNVSNT